MKLQFYKYQGAGNDFIVFDNREGVLSAADHAWFKHICNRRFGIGADGVMLFQNHPSLDFEMLYFNADGNESSMCGNGGRCMVNFAKQLGIGNSTFRFYAIDGVHGAILKDGIVELQMKDVHEINISQKHFILDTGSPHYITFVEDVLAMDVNAKGKEIRYSTEFNAGGINVNFVEMIADKILIRTYERGVEDETLSCGTGVTAAAIVVASQFKPNGIHTITMQTVGGELSVRLNKINDQHFEDIYLIGPGEFVFGGEIEYN